jgi:general L-amino acid transport system permease protein
LYLIVSLILLAAAWRAPGHLRWLVLGAAGGQLIGGLLFYFGITPTGGLRLELYPAVYMSIRGFVFPQFLATSRFAEWLAFVAVGIALAGMMWVYFGRITETTGRPIPRAWYGFLAVVGFALVGWLVVGTQPTPSEITVKKDDQPVTLTLADARKDNLLTLQDEQLYSTQPVLFILPQRTGLRIENGVEISPEYMFLLIGLVVYTASFIAEIVRAGIQAVPRGQLEASRALGFGTGQTLRMIILPQALRVIIPPLGNQYLNLAKNSSLAIAIAYADLFAVTNTIMNQSGQSVTGMTMVMFTYLAMSLTIASLMGRVNRRFQIVTR